MTKRGIIVAYHTSDPVYAGAAALLRQSIEALGLEYDIADIGATTPQAAMRYKPQFLLAMLAKHRRPLLYIDADAYVHSDPWPVVAELPRCDIALHRHATEANSATIVVAATKQALAFLRAWAAALQEAPEQYSDQEGLPAAFAANVAHVEGLPDAMCYIFDQRHVEAEPPIIEQLQASRDRKPADDPGRIRRQQRLAQLMDPLAAQRTPLVREPDFLAYFAGKRVAVVGNASSALSRTDGELIDGCDIVVRFNRGWPKPEEHAAVGSRTDVWYAGFLWEKNVRQYNELFAARRYAVFPAQVSIEYLLPGMGPTTFQIPRSFYFGLKHELGAPPSSGCIMLAYLLRRAKPESVFITGFDFFATPNRDKKAVYNSHHDPTAERRLIRSMCHDRPNVTLREPQSPALLHSNKDAAVLWPYRYDNILGTTWEQPMRWLCNALHDSGREVQIHERLKAALPHVQRYTPNGGCDIVVYNHATLREIKGNVIAARRTWFFKPTVPRAEYVTLDALGYGPYSSITYDRPAYDSVPQAEVDAFYADTVPALTANGANKWKARFDEPELWDNDFDLVVGQIPNDFVVRGMYFGGYLESLFSVVAELVRIGKRKIVVKLHPYMDGKDHKQPDLMQRTVATLREMDESKVSVYTGCCALQPFLARAHAALLCNSGSGLEAMLARKPVICWGYPEYHWTSFDLRHVCDLERALDLQWYDPGAAARFAAWYFTRYTIHDQATATRRVAELTTEAA